MNFLFLITLVKMHVLQQFINTNSECDIIMALTHPSNNIYALINDDITAKTRTKIETEIEIETKAEIAKRHLVNFIVPREEFLASEFMWGELGSTYTVYHININNFVEVKVEILACREATNVLCKKCRGEVRTVCFKYTAEEYNYESYYNLDVCVDKMCDFKEHNTYYHFGYHCAIEKFDPNDLKEHNNNKYVNHVTLRSLEQWDMLREIFNNKSKIASKFSHKLYDLDIICHN